MKSIYQGFFAFYAELFGVFFFRFNKQLLKIMQVAPGPKCLETNNIIKFSHVKV